MKDARILPLMLSTVLLAPCTTASVPNDSASRALNEMKAVARPAPAKGRPAGYQNCRARRKQKSTRRGTRTAPFFGHRRGGPGPSPSQRA